MRKILLIAVLALSSALSAGQVVGVRCCVGLTVTTPTGAAVPNPAVRVCNEPATGITCTPLASGGLFLDRGLTIPTTNPFIGDVNGNVNFYVAQGRYHLQITAPFITQFDISDVPLFDPTSPGGPIVSTVVQFGAAPSSTVTQTQAKQAAVGCTTAASVGATCTSASQSFTAAFADATYTLTCTLNTPTGVPVISSVSKLAGSFTITIAALTAVGATASYDCRASHQ